MNRRKIAVVTGSRAEYGLLYWIIKGINEDPRLKLQLIVTGTHLSYEFGLTIKEIEKDRFPIAAKVKMPLFSDTEKAIAKVMGLGLMGFADVYARLKPDIIVVLGDRFEVFAAVSAAVPFRIPIAHIHGGESTEGSYDEQLRHAITKMSHIHFPATEKYKSRIIQLGENPKNVFCFGAPGIETIARLIPLGRESLSKDLNIPGDGKIGVVTYHPVTLECNTAQRQITELLAALRKINKIYWVFTLCNADMGSRIIIKKVREFTKKFPERTTLFSSLGQQKYLSLLKNASIMVGNSSSGIIEAPTFQLPVVNIGDRQKGRVRAANVIDVKECKKTAVLAAINKALSQGFKASLKGIKNPYDGGGDVSNKIIKVLKRIALNEKLIKKQLHDFFI